MSRDGAVSCGKRSAWRPAGLSTVNGPRYGAIVWGGTGGLIGLNKSS